MAKIIRTKRECYDGSTIVIDLYANEKVEIYDYSNDFSASFFLPDIFNYLTMLEVVKNGGNRNTACYRHRIFNGLFNGNYIGVKRIQYNIDIIKEFIDEIDFPKKDKQLSKKELQDMSVEQLIFMYQRIAKKGERAHD